MPQQLLREDVAWLRREDRLGVTMNALVLVPFPEGALQAAGAPDVAGVRAHLAARLHRVPVLRQRLAWPPGGLGPPVWVDDADFDLEHHVAALTAPLRTLDDVRAHLPQLNVLLDRRRPLWRVWVSPVLDSGDVALVWVFHHALADLAFFDHIVAQVCDSEAAGEPPPWNPSAPGAARLLLASVPATVERIWRKVRSLASRPAAQPDVPHPLGTSRGPARCVGSRHLALPELRALKDGLAAATGLALTVNDVLLTGIAAGVHRQLARSGTEAATVRVLVPRDVRTGEDAATPGTITRSLVVEVPAGPMDALQRLHAVKAAADAVKAQPRYAGGEPPCDLTLSNIRMSCTMTVLGAQGRSMEMLSMMGQQPLMVIAITLGGTCTVTATVDPDVIPDTDTVLDGLVDCLAELPGRVTRFDGRVAQALTYPARAYIRRLPWAPLRRALAREFLDPALRARPRAVHHPHRRRPGLHRLDRGHDPALPLRVRRLGARPARPGCRSGWRRAAR